LGNVRLSYSKNLSGSAEVLEENNYYPFGLKHEGYNALAGNPAYSYGYSGKELQKETGWGDYGARMYMADIGRWGVIDPLAEQMRRYSPYNFAFNNPVSFIDPDGMAPHQFKMPGDSRPDAYSGGHNPNWLGLGNTGSLESGGYGGGNGYSVLSSLGTQTTIYWIILELHGLLIKYHLV
jgi:RHS repeat-associated protein